MRGVAGVIAGFMVLSVILVTGVLLTLWSVGAIEAARSAPEVRVADAWCVPGSLVTDVYVRLSVFHGYGVGYVEVVNGSVSWFNVFDAHPPAVWDGVITVVVPLAGNWSGETVGVVLYPSDVYADRGFVVVTVYCP